MSTDETLLSYESIQKIREHVTVKFPQMPKEKHADIVADVIVKVVENHLPSFSYETKKKVTHKIINKMVIERQRPLKTEDIVQLVEQEPLSDEDSLLYKQWCSIQGVFDHIIQDEVAVSTESVVATSIEVVAPKKWIQINQSTILFSAVFVGLFALIVIVTQFTVDFQREQTVQGEHIGVEETNSPDPIQYDLPHNELPLEYQFTEFDRDIIKAYLATRDSLLVDEPYFSAIYDTALEFNVHPVLLFSITGQEQGFVPRDHEQADKIVKNPFNVFYSWEDYNTNIKDTTAIAARTLVNLSKDRPGDVEAIKWINRKYAEDPNWYKGVVWFFNAITNY